MAKTKISEFDSTPANNTDIDSINIAEGCAPSGINNAIRELMSQLKDQQTGASGDNFTVGGNLAVTGSTTFTGAVVMSTALPIASGGTGATSSAATPFAIKGANSDITSITGLTTALTVAQGGTGAATHTSKGVLIGNGTSAVTTVTPSTSGNVLTSDGTNWVSSTAPAFSAYLFSNQTISSSTATKVQLNTEIFDTNSNFDSTTNYRFTPTVAGYYQINMNLALSCSGANQTQVVAYFYKNGSAYYRSEWRGSGGVGAIILTGACVMYFNGSTDYVELYGLNNGSSPFFDSGSVYTSMSGALIRSA